MNPLGIATVFLSVEQGSYAGEQMMDRRGACALLIALSVALAACDRIPFVSANQHGGAYVLLELDASDVHRRQLEDVAGEMATALRSAQPSIRYTGRGVVGDAARIRLIDPAELQRAQVALSAVGRDSTGVETLTFTAGEDALIEARLTPAFAESLVRQAAEQSIPVIRRRADPMERGGAEVTIRDDQRIYVRTPYLTDSNELSRRFAVQGLLTFHVVREVSPSEIEMGLLPPGAMLAQPYPGIGYSPEVVERRPRLTGHLDRADATVDQQTGQMALAFQLDDEGKRVFCSVTREHTGQRFAILLDNQVLTAPRINEAICGGAGQVSGSFDEQSARELATMLNAGALPAPVTIIEQGVLPRE